MNLNTLTQVNFNDPLPTFGAKVESNPKPVKVQAWLDTETPGVQKCNLTGKLRSNFALPPTALEQALTKVVTDEIGPAITNPRSVVKALAPSVVPGAEEWRIDPPTENGWYYAYSYGNLSTVAKHLLNVGFEHVKYFHNGDWYYDKELTSPAGFRLATAWHPREVPGKERTLVLDPAFEIPNSGGWRKDTPPKDGMYYATNFNSSSSSELECIKACGFDFVKYYLNGKWWYDRNGAREFVTPLIKIWHPRPVPATKE